MLVAATKKIILTVYIKIRETIKLYGVHNKATLHTPFKLPKAQYQGNWEQKYSAINELFYVRNSSIFKAQLNFKTRS